MTKVSFSQSEDEIVSFEIKGHSGYAEEGEDIVCASISSCAYMVANTITEICGINADIKVEDGYFFLSVSHSDAKKCSVLMKGFELHLNALAEQYPDFITVRRSTVSK